MLKAVVGVVGSTRKSYCAQQLVGFLLDEPAHPLGLGVVGVVVAGAQHEGAQQDPALHFRPETLGAGLLVERLQVRDVRGAVAVLHAIEAAQVGAGFGSGENVVASES